MHQLLWGLAFREWHDGFASHPPGELFTLLARFRCTLTDTALIARTHATVQWW
jgi:hypothetical protein